MTEPIYVFAPVHQNKKSGVEWIDRTCIRESAEEALVALRRRILHDGIVFSDNNPLVRITRMVITENE